MILSNATNGKAIQVTGINDAGSVLLHTAVAGTSSIDAIFLDAFNNGSTDVVLTIEIGSNAAKDLMYITIAAKSGLQRVLSGAFLNNGGTVKAYADTANVISIIGKVQRMA